MAFTLKDSTNTTTLFTFNTTTKVISNPESMLEQFGFHTQVKPRHAQKAIIRREVGITNKILHVKVVLSGSNKDTDLATLMDVLEDNEFIYLNSGSFQTRLDGIYGFYGNGKQKRDAYRGIITIEFDLIEKEA
jgi:hypothetical protein